MDCECGWTQPDTPWYAHHHHHEIDQLKREVAKLMSQQDEINADVTELQSAATNIQAEIAALQSQIDNGQPLDLTGLKTAADVLAAIAPAPVSATSDQPSGDQPSA